MMRLFAFLTAILFFISCEDKNKDSYNDRLVLLGNTTNLFSNVGEEREFAIQLISEPSLNLLEAEDLLKSSEITFKTDNDFYDFSECMIIGNTIRFIVSCKENQTENIIKDIIRVYIENKRFKLEVSEELTQQKSEVTYEYKIESEIASTFTIPAEGGLFSIPVKCKRITYLNGNFVLEEPYSLNGIRYTSNCVNISWGHSDKIYKEESIGDYVIELEADGPYNIDYDYLWTVELLDGEKLLYLLNILHPQTPGEDYYIGTSTHLNTYLIND